MVCVGREGLLEMLLQHLAHLAHEALLAADRRHALERLEESSRRVTDPAFFRRLAVGISSREGRSADWLATFFLYTQSTTLHLPPSAVLVKLRLLSKQLPGHHRKFQLAVQDDEEKLQRAGLQRIVLGHTKALKEAHQKN